VRASISAHWEQCFLWLIMSLIRVVIDAVSASVS
jgi:hypothetical protein